MEQLVLGAVIDHQFGFNSSQRRPLAAQGACQLLRGLNLQTRIQ